MVLSNLLKIFKRYNLDDLLMAAKADDLQRVEEVLDKGPDINSSKENGVTALHIASGNGNVEMVEMLLWRDANIDAFSDIWGTPLFMAAEKGHMNVVKMLLEKGADIYKRNTNNSTALALAKKKGHSDIVKLLKDKGAKEAHTRCKSCKKDIESEEPLESMEKKYKGLCNDCFLEKYREDHSVQDMQMNDGTNAIVLKTVPVERVKIKQMDFSDIDYIVNAVEDELRTLGSYQPWNLTISGYDDDPRALVEIPEVRTWCKKCLAENPTILALLSQSSVDWFVFAAIGSKPTRNANGKLEVDMQLSDKDMQTIIANSMIAWNFFADCGIDNEEAGRMARVAQRRLPWFKDMPEY